MGFPKCKQCNEKILPGWGSPVRGVCYDCYAIEDMDRLIPVDTRPEETQDTSHTPKESSHEPLPQKPSLHTNPFVNFHARRATEAMMEAFGGCSEEVRDKSTPEPSPQPPQSSADKEDK